MPRDCSISNSRRPSGFALIVTIVLVAFLVLILVGLATFTRVETQVADNTASLSRARQNALTGLNVAIGELQKAAGPDQRITATGASTGTTEQNPFFTGVWDSSGNATAPIKWLVSGNEISPLQYSQATNLDRTASSPEVALTLDGNGLATNGPGSGNVNRVLLVGPGSVDTSGSGLANGAVVVPGVPLNAEVLGFASSRTIGRYAFWIGDQSVKASVALPDLSARVTYAPWDNETARLQIRQQIASAPSMFRNIASERYGFDPLQTINADKLGDVVADKQIAMLSPVDTSADLPLFLRRNYHSATSATFGVLANTRTDSNRGLMKDLSLAPNLFGAAFQARANYTSYMEVPSAANTAVPPISSEESLRRRYRITPPVSTSASGIHPAVEFSVAPVLSDFIIQFRVQRAAGNVQVSTRTYAALWNPYTSALVPEDLSIELTGLPSVTITDPDSTASVAVDLQADAPTVIRPGSSLEFGLPWDTSGSRTDFRSWLPGRMHGWVTTTGPGPSASLTFYNKNLNGVGWNYLPVPLAGTADNLSADVSSSTQLTLVLKRGSDTLATYTSPSFPSFSVLDVSSPAGDTGWKFAFAFRLKQPSSTSTDRSWLITAGEDPRRSTLGASSFVAFDATRGLDPSAYTSTIATSTGVDNFILFRSQGGGSAASATSSRAVNDLPLFELPRLPLLSLGELQHLLVPDRRPFAIGNPWTPAFNQLFDRYFFSGLPPSPSVDLPDLLAGQPFPNWNLRWWDSRGSPTAPLTATDIQAEAENSSRFLLQAGAFNINSVNESAWEALLSSMRFSSNRPFRRVDIENSEPPAAINDNTGSQRGSGLGYVDELLADSTLDAGGAGGPAFFRFPQSAGETYFWSSASPPNLLLSREPFRRGVRGGNTSDVRALTKAQIRALSDEIVQRVRQKFAASGPFRSLQEFLEPVSGLYNGTSLLNDAIAAVPSINPPAIQPSASTGLSDLGFSSLTLTQADVVSALAPYLRTRGDTFVIRSYGEVINPASGQVEGKAWCEATLQRVSSTVDSADSIEQPNGAFGRKFTIISFRWLSSDDI